MMNNFKVLLMLLILPTIVKTQNGLATHERKEAREASGDLDAMKEAFRKMREMDCMNGTSWFYQGAIHYVPETTNIMGTHYSKCPTYKEDGVKQFGWSNCPHVSCPQENCPLSKNADFHFLLWHRLYIWHLEKIVREMSGHKEFSLPYWEYIVEDGRLLPEAFQKENSSLHTPSRSPILNAGDPIPDDWFTNIQNGVEAIETMTNYFTFSQNLEHNPHDFMHGQIGGDGLYNPILQQNNVTGLMALVETSAFDPIFYLHHGIIDYLFWRWDTSEYGRRPCLDVLEQYPWTYNFINPDGSEVTYTVKEAYDLVYNPDYFYQGLPKKSPSWNRTCTSLESMKSVNSFSMTLDQAPFALGKAPEGKTSEHLIDFASLNNTDGRVLYLYIYLTIYENLCESFPVYIRHNMGTEETYIGMITHFGFAKDIGIPQGRVLNFQYKIPKLYRDSPRPFQVVIKSDSQCQSSWKLDHIDINYLDEEEKEGEADSGSDSVEDILAQSGTNKGTKMMWVIVMIMTMVLIL